MSQNGQLFDKTFWISSKCTNSIIFAMSSFGTCLILHHIPCRYGYAYATARASGHIA